MSDLFEIPEQLSPRLKWMKEHDVHTDKCRYLQAGEAPWSAWQGDMMKAMSFMEISTGETEDEAIVHLAKAMGWKLWNEEAL